MTMFHSLKESAVMLPVQGESRSLLTPLYIFLALSVLVYKISTCIISHVFANRFQIMYLYYCT